MDKIEIANYIIENEKIPKEFDNYVILQISDLHNKSFGKNNCKLISKIDQINPQVVFITGDIIDGENKKIITEWIEQEEDWYCWSNRSWKELIACCLITTGEH